MKLLIALVAALPVICFAQNGEILRLHKSEIEALQPPDGTYARFSDISEGFVSLPGVSTNENFLFVNLKKSMLNSIILQNGSRLNQTILNNHGFVIGGDMGGGGTAH